MLSDLPVCSAVGLQITSSYNMTSEGDILVKQISERLAMVGNSVSQKHCLASVNSKLEAQKIFGRLSSIFFLFLKGYNMGKYKSKQS